VPGAPAGTFVASFAWNGLAPPVPKQQACGIYVAVSSRADERRRPGRGDFLGDSLECVDRGSPTRRVEGNLNENLESPQAQDWKWNRKQEMEGFASGAHPEGIAVEAHPEGFTVKADPEAKQYAAHDRANVRETAKQQLYLPNLNSKAEISGSESTCAPSPRRCGESIRAPLLPLALPTPTANSIYFPREVVCCRARTGRRARNRYAGRCG